MLIGIMSDTHDHVPKVIEALKKFKEKKVETIIHLGDIISPFVVKKMISELENTGIKVFAVRGNNDGDIALLMKLFREVGWELYSSPTIINVGGKKFLIMHGYNGIDWTESLAMTMAKMEDIDAVLFGHTHRKFVKTVDGKLVLNPGEVCGYLTGVSSIVVLNTSNMNADFIELK